MPTLPVVLWLKSCVNGPSNPPVCAPLGVLKSQMGSQRKPCEISYEKSPFFFAHNIIPSIVFFALFFIFLPPSLHDRNSDPGPLKQAFLPRPHYGTRAQSHQFLSREDSKAFRLSSSTCTALRPTVRGSNYWINQTICHQFLTSYLGLFSSVLSPCRECGAKRAKTVNAS